MISFYDYMICQESYETVERMFLDPSNKDKFFDEISDDFKKSGGRHLGSGSYGSVYHHPNWPYVVKSFAKDDPYLKFVRYAYANPNKAFPKFYGLPKKIVPQYSRYKGDNTIYLVRIEKLKPIDDHLYDIINKYKGLFSHYLYYKNSPAFKQAILSTSELLTYKDLYNRVKNIPTNIYNALIAYHEIEQQANSWGVATDFHKGNFMQRDNGDIVLIDPVWEGYNQQEAEDYARKMEYDYYGGEEYENDEPTVIRGGEVLKKKREKKKKQTPIEVKDEVDDIPF